jgi:hypothetical protein
VCAVTEARPASNWDETLKEDRPLCSNRHFCTIKEPQHWVEYKHSTSTAEVMAKLRNPRAQGDAPALLHTPPLAACQQHQLTRRPLASAGKLYGSNTLDARSRVRPAELRKGDNP